jgi:hypothetical protein
MTEVIWVGVLWILWLAAGAANTAFSYCSIGRFYSYYYDEYGEIVPLFLRRTAYSLH